MITQYFAPSSLLYHRDRYADRSIPPWPLPCLIHKSIPPRSVHDGGGGLLTTKHIDVLNIDMSRTADHKGNDLCNITTSQWLEIFVHLLAAFFVSVKPNFGKFRLFHVRRRHLPHPDAVFVQIDPHGMCERIHRVFGRTIYVTPGIRLLSGYRTHIDDLAFLLLYHPSGNDFGYVQQPLNIGVNHLFPVFQIAFVYL